MLRIISSLVRRFKAVAEEYCSQQPRRPQLQGAPQTLLVKCQLGNDAGIIGAALLGKVQMAEGRC